MTRTERNQISRQNAQKSTGPKSAEGKERARLNALKHGLRAETVALPNEDRAAVKGRTEQWNDYYQPRNPAEQHFVNQAVAATLLAERCQRSHAAVLAKQVREAATQWDREREDEVEGFQAQLTADPVGAVRGLKRSGLGCRWLLGRWRELDESYRFRGHWNKTECAEVTRLLGHHPEELAQAPEAWLIRFYNVVALENPNPKLLEWLQSPELIPESLRWSYGDGWLPDPEFCRGELRLHIDGQIAELTALEARWRTEIDEPDRAEAADRALMVTEGEGARLFLRYHAEARTAFLRAYNGLVKAQKDDVAEWGAEQVSTEQPIATPSPNEANRAGELDATPQEESTSDETEPECGGRTERGAFPRGGSVTFGGESRVAGDGCPGLGSSWDRGCETYEAGLAAVA